MPDAKLYATTNTTYVISFFGQIAISAATPARVMPESAYAVRRFMRSDIQPPAMQPIAAITPPRMPVTIATVSADACQRSAIAESRLDAAPAPSGVKQRINATAPRRVPNVFARSMNTFFIETMILRPAD